MATAYYSNGCYVDMIQEVYDEEIHTFFIELSYHCNQYGCHSQHRSHAFANDDEEILLPQWWCSV